MATRYPPGYNDDWLRQGAPTGLRCQNLDTVLDCTSDTASLTTQVMTSTYLGTQPGDFVSNLTFISGATAAGTPTNWWFALYDAATLALLGQSADQLTAAWAADTAKTLPIVLTGRPGAAGAYGAVMVKATTPPSLLGVTLGRATASAAILGSKVVSQTSGSALTTTAPATIATPTAIAAVPFCIAT